MILSMQKRWKQISRHTQIMILFHTPRWRKIRPIERNLVSPMKRNEPGRVVCYSFRLVVKRSKQKIGVASYKTCSPVAYTDFIRVQFYLLASKGYCVNSWRSWKRLTVLPMPKTWCASWTNGSTVPSRLRVHGAGRFMLYLCQWDLKQRKRSLRLRQG